MKAFSSRGFFSFLSVTLLGTITSILTTTVALAALHDVRWTASEHARGDLPTLVTQLNKHLGLNLSTTDFYLFEDRDLATAHFQTWLQQTTGVPIKNAMIRIWTDPKTSQLIQMEASLEDGKTTAARLAFLSDRQSRLGFAFRPLDHATTLQRVQSILSQHESDRTLHDLKWRDQWEGNALVRTVLAKGRRGVHTLRIDMEDGRVLSSTYALFPQADIQALVFPIYEEPAGENGKIQTRVKKTLSHLKEQTYDVQNDPYSSTLAGQYTDQKMDPVLGATAAGEAQGYWSMQVIKGKAKTIRDQLALRANDFSRGLVLDGLYASVNIHPAAVAQFAQDLKFTPGHSGEFYPLWKTTVLNNQEVGVMIPSSAFLGRPLTSATDALNRVAERLPDHNPAQYLNAGFDEIQVYSAVDQLMASMHAMGFSDPELSTRPFHAFLYDPDIAMRDNAYYTDDTINFTTYSPHAQNFARDNSTIWHELGHGVMDRLMGDLIHLSDSGGLAEGMADFVAALVVQDVTDGVPFDGSDKFRIINKTAFHLTNESHDDGEAYGGAMKDFLDAAVRKWGRAGLLKVTDVTLEAMRLARNHPSLDANAWFDHVLFADSLGGKDRAPGELGDLLKTALASRNFSLSNQVTADYHVIFNNEELTSRSLGSRAKPVQLKLTETQEKTYTLSAQLKSSPAFAFKYPVRIEVSYNGGPLQGPLHWKGEEQGSQFYTLNSESEVAHVPVTATSRCDAVNIPTGGCVDFAYIRVWNSGEDRPAAKKRFYVRLLPQSKN